MKVLVERGAKVDHVSFLGETALHWLVSFPDEVVTAAGSLVFCPASLVRYALVSKLTQAAAATGLTIVPGTPLHRAVALRRRAIVEFHLESGGDGFLLGESMFDMDALRRPGVAGTYEAVSANDRAMLPIHRACQAHDDEMMELLLSRGPMKLPKWAAHKGQPRGLIAAVRMGADDGSGCKNFLSRSLLGYACDPTSRFSRMTIHGPRQRVALRSTFDLLLSKPGQTLSKVDFTGKSALITACMAGDTELVLHILALAGSHSTLELSFGGGWGTRPLHVATAQNNIVVVEAMLGAGADPMAERSAGQKAMLVCASSFLPDLEMSRLLLSKEPKLAAMESYWDTPFSAAVRNHDFDCARMLLAHGADRNQVINKTSTALGQVLASDHVLPAVDFLLGLPDISFEVAPRKKSTALHAPFIGRLRYNYYDEFELGGAVDVFDAMLAKWNSKEHLEACEIRGGTALHLACFTGDIEVTAQLLEHIKRVGADVNIMATFFGSPVWSTPLDLVEIRRTAPGIVVKRGPAAVMRYNENTARLRQLLVEAGGKHRIEALNDRWNEVSFVERLKATLLTNRVTWPFASLAGFLYFGWLAGIDGWIWRMRLWTQSNPDEVWYRRGE